MSRLAISISVFVATQGAPVDILHIPAVLTHSIQTRHLSARFPRPHTAPRLHARAVRMVCVWRARMPHILLVLERPRGVQGLHDMGCRRRREVASFTCAKVFPRREIGLLLLLLLLLLRRRRKSRNTLPVG